MIKDDSLRNTELLVAWEIVLFICTNNKHFQIWGNEIFLKLQHFNYLTSQWDNNTDDIIAKKCAIRIHKRISIHVCIMLMNVFEHIRVPWNMYPIKRRCLEHITPKMIIMVPGHWPHNFCLICRGYIHFVIDFGFHCYCITTFTKTCQSVEYTVNQMANLSNMNLKSSRVLPQT